MTSSPRNGVGNPTPLRGARCSGKGTGSSAGHLVIRSGSESCFANATSTGFCIATGPRTTPQRTPARSSATSVARGRPAGPAGRRTPATRLHPIGGELRNRTSTGPVVDGRRPPRRLATPHPPRTQPPGAEFTKSSTTSDSPPTRRSPPTWPRFGRQIQGCRLGQPTPAWVAPSRFGNDHFYSLRRNHRLGRRAERLQHRPAQHARTSPGSRHAEGDRDDARSGGDDNGGPHGHPGLGSRLPGHPARGGCAPPGPAADGRGRGARPSGPYLPRLDGRRSVPGGARGRGDRGPGRCPAGPERWVRISAAGPAVGLLANGPTEQARFG